MAADPEGYVILCGPPYPLRIESWRIWTGRARELGLYREVRRGEWMIALLEEVAADRAARVEREATGSGADPEDGHLRQSSECLERLIRQIAAERGVDKRPLSERLKTFLDEVPSKGGHADRRSS